jgi:hypothetical protein
LIAARNADFSSPDCASAKPIMPIWAANTVTAAVPTKRRRS